jgi:HD superfamily phosphodiesterase
MNKRLNSLIEEITNLYQNSKRPFAKWGFKNHVQVVSFWCEKISKEKNANTELLIAAAFLHDISDVWNNRPQNHEALSYKKGKQILTKHGYFPQEISIILDQIISPHSAKDENMPLTLEAKILATADALAHFDSDFYLAFAWNHYNQKTLDAFKNWALEKIDRDYNAKIFFKEYQSCVKQKYLALKTILSR